MSGNAREYLWAVDESALGTVMTGPVAGTNSNFVRLTDGSFTGSADPVMDTIGYGGGYAVDAEQISDHYACKWSFKTPLYPTQASYWLSWALTRVSSDQTLPYPTTEAPGDLASKSLFHAVRKSNGTYFCERFAGSKVTALTIDVSRRSTAATLTLEGVAARSYPNEMDGSAAPAFGTDMPAPAETDYPVGPYTFKQTAGHLTANGTRAKYDSLSVKVANAIDGRWWEASYLQDVLFLGRTGQVDAELYFQADVDDRVAYQALTSGALSVGFVQGSHNLTLDFKGANRLSSVKFNLPTGQAFTRQLSLKNLFDRSAGNDLTFSAA